MDDEAERHRQQFLEAFDSLDEETQILFLAEAQRVVSARSKGWQTRRLREMEAWAKGRAATFG